MLLSAVLSVSVTSIGAKNLALLLIWLLIPYLCSKTTTAETICNPDDPPPLVPSVGSCNYAISRLEALCQRCGSLPLIWTGIPAGPGAVNLPLTILGQGPDYQPPTRVWCTLLILWQPRPNSRVPPPTLADFFPINRVLYAAKNIRNMCLMDSPWSLPRLGREWILPNQWVDVQLGYVVAPSYGGHGDRVTVHMADGSNQTVNAHPLEAGHDACEDLMNLGRGSLRTTA